MKKEYWNTLAEAALDARKDSYSPYSKFSVGAALLTQSGKIYRGANIENSSYSLGVCAERTAFFSAVLAGEKEFVAIAIAGGYGETPEELCPPCGACLQVMAEFCDPDSFEVLFVKDKTEGSCHLLREMLPFGFSLKEPPRTEL